MRKQPGPAIASSVLAILLCLGLLFVPSGPKGPLGVVTVRAASCPTVANTPSFSIAYGTVQLDDAGAPVGAAVEALNPRGDVVGCFEVTTSGNYGAMFVYGEDTSVQPALPGMREGETVTFRVNGGEASAVPELQWAADRAFHWVALSASSNPTSVECYGLVLDSNPSQGGTVDAEPAATCAPIDLHGHYVAGTQVQVRAVPVPGFRFSHWSGDAKGNANPVTLIMDRDRSFIANFVLLETEPIYLPLIRGGR